MKCLTDFSGSGLALNRQVHLVFSLLLASCFLFWLFPAVFLISTWVMALLNGGKGTQEESAAAVWLGSHSQSLVPLTVQQALHIHAQLNESSDQCCLQTFLHKTTLLSLQKQRIHDSRLCQDLSLVMAGKTVWYKAKINYIAEACSFPSVVIRVLVPFF